MNKNNRLIMNKLKQVNTLFHTTGEIDNIISILTNGFTPSYSRELFGKNVSQIAMVSFSNVLLMETRSQINYGNYSIGMTKEWGVKNNLQPVFYTYENSITEKSLNSVRQIFDLANLFSEINPYLSNNMMDMKYKHMEYEDLGLESFDKLIRTRFDRNQSKIIEEFLTEISGLFIYYELHSKRIIAKNKKDIEFICFNDREWRYIPDFEYKLSYEPMQSNDDIEYAKRLNNYEERLRQGKLQLPNHTLKFELNDLKSVIVNEETEIKIIFDTLIEIYSEESIMEKICNGSLLITSYNQLYNNF